VGVLLESTGFFSDGYLQPFFSCAALWVVRAPDRAREQTSSLGVFCYAGIISPLTNLALFFWSVKQRAFFGTVCEFLFCSWVAPEISSSRRILPLAQLRGPRERRLIVPRRNLRSTNPCARWRARSIPGTSSFFPSLEHGPVFLIFGNCFLSQNTRKYSAPSIKSRAVRPVTRAPRTTFPPFSCGISFCALNSLSFPAFRKDYRLAAP